jgi:hypothetical protein
MNERQDESFSALQAVEEVMRDEVCLVRARHAD